jgi:hypothetical protein
VRFNPELHEFASQLHVLPKVCTPRRANEKGRVEVYWFSVNATSCSGAEDSRGGVDAHPPIAGLGIGGGRRVLQVGMARPRSRAGADAVRFAFVARGRQSWPWGPRPQPPAMLGRQAALEADGWVDAERRRSRRSSRARWSFSSRAFHISGPRPAA